MNTCTRCECTGFLNIDQVDDETLARFDGSGNDVGIILDWIKANESDVQICDCCGFGEGWYGTPGYHYGPEDLPGNSGPYAYNGGICECH